MVITPFLVVAAIILAFPALIYASVRKGVLAETDVADDTLVVRPLGLNRVWALKGEVRVPLSQISEVRPHVDRTQVRSGLRVPGTSFPGLIQAGTYRSQGQKSFWLVGRTRQVTVIECAGGKFDRIVLQLSDKRVEELRRALNSRGAM